VAHTWTWRATGEPLYVSAHAGALTLSLAGKSNLSFDGEGRLLGAWFDEVTYRRALDNRILAKWRDPGRLAIRCRRILAASERREVIERAYATAQNASAALAQGDLDVEDTPPTEVAELADWLARTDAWNWSSLEAAAARFHTIYKPVSILPPDQYLAVVLQATEGCSYNRCTFCTFYRDRPFRIKSAAEFADHCAQVREFFGRGLAVRRTIFLADANAVIVPQRLLVPFLETANRVFLDGACAGTGWQHDGIYAFVSAPDALHKSAVDLVAMRDLGMRRLYLGLETGHDPLRAFIAKQGRAADVLDAVHTIKAGGLAVGIIVMVGIGGESYRVPHFEATTALIRRMPLDRDDLLYLSPFVPGADATYTADVIAAGIAALDEAAVRVEEHRFRQALAPWAAERGVRISHYDVREFTY
jgi:hypothetical protein